MLRDKNLKNRIIQILTNLPHCRDSDSRLIANIWQRQAIAKVGIERYMSMRPDDLLKLFVQGKLSSPESIRRTRQKIQERYPMLRGENYQIRQNHQSKVKQEVREFYHQ